MTSVCFVNCLLWGGGGGGGVYAKGIVRAESAEKERARARAFIIQNFA
jgi:hypothetical protein